MTRRAHLAAWCVLWLAGWLACPVWVGPERLAALTTAEVAAAQATFGPRLSSRVLSAAGMCAERPRVSQRAAVPAQAGSAGLAGLAGLVRATEAWRGGTCLLSLRVAGLAAWALLLFPVVLAAAVDGLATRAIRADTLGERNPAAFAVSGHLLIAALMSSVLLALVPVPWPVGWGAVWLALACWPLRMALIHLQPVFTR